MPSHFHFFLVPLPLCPAMSVHDHVPYFFVVHRASSSAASFSVMCNTTRAHETTQESSSMEGKEKHHFEVIDWWSEVKWTHGMAWTTFRSLESLRTSTSSAVSVLYVRFSQCYNPFIIPPLCICADSVIRSETHTHTPIQIHLERPEGIRSRTSRGRTVKCHRVT